MRKLAKMTDQPNIPLVPEVVPAGKFNPLPIVFLLVAILLVGIGGVYAGIMIGRKQAAVPIPVFEPTVTPAIDETANWKVYTNEKYWFEFRYPDKYEYQSTGPNLFQQQLDRGEQISGTVAPSYDTLSFTGPDAKFSVGIFHIVPENQKEGLLIGGDGSCGSQFAEKYLVNKVDNEPFGHREIRQEWLGKKIDLIYCFISGEGNLITLHADNLSESQIEMTAKFLSQILATFKFTSTVKDATANWKTYTNTEAGFEFKYPQNFRITAEGVGQYFLNQKPAVVLESDNFNYLHNQVNAILTVSVKSNAESECTYVPRGVVDTLHNQVINGINFTVFSESGAAAGNIYSNTIFHYLKDTTCYEMVATIHESGDNNTPEALLKINEQKTNLENQFNQILSTFKFTD